jgi:hypothetical protein
VHVLWGGRQGDGISRTSLCNSKKGRLWRLTRTHPSSLATNSESAHPWKPYGVYIRRSTAGPTGILTLQRPPLPDRLRSGQSFIGNCGNGNSFDDWRNCGPQKNRLERRDWRHSWHPCVELFGIRRRHTCSYGRIMGRSFSSRETKDIQDALDASLVRWLSFLKARVEKGEPAG